MTPRRQDPNEKIAELLAANKDLERRYGLALEELDAMTQTAELYRGQVVAIEDLVAWLCSEHPIAGLTVSLNVTDGRDLARIAILTGIVAEDTAGGSREA